MRVLVVTPTLGKGPWLDAAVASIRQFAPSADHVIVAPVDLADDLERRFGGSRVIAESSQGVYAAVNQAARTIPDWEWMTYLNDDDLLLPGFLGSLDRAGQEDQADVVYGRVRYFSSDGRSSVSMPIEPAPRRLQALMASGVSPITQQGTLVRKRCFELLGGFDERLRLVSDFDFWVRATRSGGGFVHVADDVAGFRVRTGQLSADRSLVKREMSEILNRHFPRRRRWEPAAFRFRTANILYLLKRRSVFGAWRSESIFERSRDG
jgi:GT2 family glycosyltransferase